jgi:superoxide dismutase, Cu-Zn family
MLEHRTAALLAAIALAACGGQARGPGGAKLPDPLANASLFDTLGTRVGLATFSEVDGKGRMGVSVSGLSPGQHGMHIHETGACTPPDFESAGSHFNPASKKHGLLNPDGPHAGDMPNLVVEADGSADTTLTVSANLLAQGPESMIGAQKHAFVIHADPDDQKTDPSGNSGSRVVCGVIEPR